MTNQIKKSLEKLKKLADNNNHTFKVEQFRDYKIARYFISHDYSVKAGKDYVNRTGRGKYIRSDEIRNIIENVKKELTFLRREGFFTPSSENY